MTKSLETLKDLNKTAASYDSEWQSTYKTHVKYAVGRIGKSGTKLHLLRIETVMEDLRPKAERRPGSYKEGQVFSVIAPGCNTNGQHVGRADYRFDLKDITCDNCRLTLANLGELFGAAPVPAYEDHMAEVEAVKTAVEDLMADAGKTAAPLVAPPTVWADTVDLDLWADVVRSFDPTKVVEFAAGGVTPDYSATAHNVYQKGGRMSGMWLGFLYEYTNTEYKKGGVDAFWSARPNGVPTESDTRFDTMSAALFEFPWVRTALNEAYVMRLAKDKADEIMSGKETSVTCPDCMGTGEWVVRRHTGVFASKTCEKCQGSGQVPGSVTAPVRKDTSPLPTDEQIVKAANDLLFGLPSFQATYGDWRKHAYSNQYGNPDTKTPEDALALMLSNASLLKLWAEKLEAVLESRLR